MIEHRYSDIIIVDFSYIYTPFRAYQFLQPAEYDQFIVITIFELSVFINLIYESHTKSEVMVT